MTFREALVKWQVSATIAHRRLISRQKWHFTFILLRPGGAQTPFVLSKMITLQFFVRAAFSIRCVIFSSAKRLCVAVILHVCVRRGFRPYPHLYLYYMKFCSRTYRRYTCTHIHTDTATLKRSSSLSNTKPVCV